MEKEPKWLIFGIVSVMLIVLTAGLLQESIFQSGFASFYSWKYNFQSKKVDIKEQEELMKMHMRRLVRGKDRAQFDATGFVCNFDFNTEICIINKPAVINNNKNNNNDSIASTIYVPSNQVQVQRYTLRPYARREDKTAMDEVTPLEILHGKLTSPTCDVTHGVPAVVFSSGGFTGNIFHEMNEIIIPLFITCRHFKSRVKFVVTDYRDWWVWKYGPVLKHLSRYDVVNATGDQRVHCFPGAIIGLRYHDNLALNPSDIPGGYTMTHFKNFLSESFNLTHKVTPYPNSPKPKLLLLSRQLTRVILNENELAQLMAHLGFQVHIARPSEMLYLDKFAPIVNSCDVMVGAHGAGLTNEVFLPSGAVVVQLVSLGLDWAAENYYAAPAHKMGLRYLEYKLEPKESTLYDLYGPDDLIISDPGAVIAKGYRAFRAVYIDGQNFTIDVDRFRGTLAQVLKLLR